MWWKRAGIGAAQGVEQRPPGEAVRAQAVQDRAVEAGEGGEARIGVQRVAVAGQPVQQRLRRQRRVADLVVGGAVGRHVLRAGRAALAAEAALAADEDRTAQRVQRLAVADRLGLGDDDPGLLLVVHRDDRDVSVALPSTGTSRCSVTACVPWTTIAGLNVPAFFNADPIAVPQPITTGNVGSTRCGTPLVFSVVKASSSVPAPTPTAYSRASLLSQLTSTGSLSVPTASGLSGIAADYERAACLAAQPERDRPRVG